MSEPKLAKLMDEGLVKITANFGDGKVMAYNVPRSCRYFAANELVNMGAVGVIIGNVSVSADELAGVA
jgi:hypothetical protein